MSGLGYFAARPIRVFEPGAGIPADRVDDLTAVVSYQILGPYRYKFELKRAMRGAGA